MHRRIHALTFTCIFIGACGGGKSDSDSEASDTGATGTDTTGTNATDATDATDSIGMSSAPTTSGDDGSGSANPTQDSGTATGSTAGGVTTTGDTATTGGDPDLMKLCEAWCSKNAGCQASQPDGCAADCFAELGSGESVCAEAEQALLNCMLGMTCEEFVAFTDKEDPGPCAAESSAVDEACADQACTGSIGTSEDSSECSYSVDCPNQPLREMQCTVETCTCLEDFKEVGTCPAMGVCMTLEDIGAKSMDCCGFA